MQTVIDVLQVVTSTDRRGAETFAVALGTALVERGLATQTVALTRGRSGPELDLPVLGNSALGIRTLRALRVLGKQARVVVAHGSRTLPACAAALAGTGVPFVYRNIGDPRHWATTPLAKLRTGLFLRRARAVVALTDQAARIIGSTHRVAAEKITVIPTGASAEQHRPSDIDDRTAARVALGLPEAAPVIVAVGALSPEKGLELAIDAVADLPRVHLVIVGDGPQRRVLESRGTEKASGRVHFTGALADPGIAFAAADVVLLSSYTEGLPAVLIEAGLRGLPSVATNVGFVSDIVVNEETGITVEPGDRAALRAGILRSLELAPTAGPAAQRRCLAKFELSVVADRWTELLETITGIDPGPTSQRRPDRRSDSR